MNTIGKRYGVLAVCATLLIALDQWAKSMAYNTLRVNGPLVLIKGVFELLYSENRAVRGFVVDFFYFSLIDFPIFNVADCYVVCAAGLLILLIGFFYKEDELSFLSSKKGE